MKSFERALIVDDDRDLCSILKIVLHRTIKDVYCAETLHEAKKIFLDVKPEVVFLDNNLPDGRGINSIEEFKHQVPRPLVIVITAAAETKWEAMIGGADVFLKKPFTSSGVREALESQLYGMT